MNTGRKFSHLIASWMPVFSVLLVVAILAMALPQSGLAQTTCRTYHTVREGDTKPYIAHTYGVKWSEIAAANDLSVEEKPAVGMQLCIPEATSDNETTGGKPKTQVDEPEGEGSAVIQISISGGRISVHTDNFNKDHLYLVKTRDVDAGTGSWYKLGNISVQEDESQSFSFNIPQDLRDEPVLSVCLKDQTSDELICQSVSNP
jgi:hypothetical protein